LVIDGYKIVICFVVFVFVLVTRTWAFLNPRSPSLGEPHMGAPMGYPIFANNHGSVVQLGGMAMKRHCCDPAALQLLFTKPAAHKIFVQAHLPHSASTQSMYKVSSNL
jgi:hypothetical protein